MKKLATLFLFLCLSPSLSYAVYLDQNLKIETSTDAESTNEKEDTDVSLKLDSNKEKIFPLAIEDDIDVTIESPDNTYTEEEKKVETNSETVSTNMFVEIWVSIKEWFRSLFS